MANDLQEYTVEELVKHKIIEKPLDGNHGEIHPKGDDFVDEGIPFIMASDLSDGRVNTKTCKFITPAQANMLRKGFAKTGDVLLSHKATIGRTAIVEELESDFIVLTPQVTYYRVKNSEKLNNLYLKYYFDSDGFQDILSNWAGGGSTRAYLGITAQLKLPIIVPDISVQKAIVHVLGTLDNRIELNRRMNEILEAMAQALFKSWFVDFDPVIDNALAKGKEIPEVFREKAQARAALGHNCRHLPEEIRSLFPDEFISRDELGCIPKRWSLRPIGECFELLGGHPFNSGEYVHDGYFGVVTIKNVQNGHFVQECTNRITKLPEKIKNHCRLEGGDVLLSLTGNVGRVCLACEGNYLLNQRVSKIVGVDGIPNSFAYFFFRQKWIYENMIAISKGTAQQNLSPIETTKIKQVLPSNKVVVKLSKIFESISKKILYNINTSSILIGLRDTFLPKLLSGELRIPDAEKMIEDFDL